MWLLLLQIFSKYCSSAVARSGATKGGWRVLKHPQPKLGPSCNSSRSDDFLYRVGGEGVRSVDSYENPENCCHQMAYFKAKNAPQSISAGAPPQTPLGELTALPQTP